MRNNDRKRTTCRSQVLRTCSVPLSDVALDSRVIKLYPKLAVAFDKIRKERADRSLSRIDRSDGFSNRAPCSLRSAQRKENAVLRGERSAAMRNYSRCAITRGNKNRVTRIAFRSNDRDTHVTSRVSSNFCNGNRGEFVPPERPSASDAYSPSVCGTSTDPTFLPSTLSSDRTHGTRIRSECTRYGRVKDQLRFENTGVASILADTADNDRSNKANLPFNDRNANDGTFDASTERSVTCVQPCSHHSRPVDQATDSPPIPKRRKEERDAGVPFNVAGPDMQSQVFVNTRSRSTIRAKVSFGLSEMRDRRKVTRMEANKLKRSLPRIVADDIVPQGTINVTKLDSKSRIDLSLNSFSKQMLLKRNGYRRSSDRNAKETGNDDVAESTSVPREGKRRRSCHMDRSIDGSTTSESSQLASLELDDRVTFNAKDLSNGTLESKVAHGRDNSDDFARLMSNARGKTAADSEKTITDKRRAVSRVRSDGLHVNDKTVANDRLQIGKTCRCDSSDENASSESALRLTDTEVEMRGIGEFADQQVAASQSRKHIAENDVTRPNLRDERIKLNVHHWLENQTFVGSRDDERSNVSGNGTIIDPSTVYRCQECIDADGARSGYKTVDLRDYLNRKKLNGTRVPTFEGNEGTCEKLSIEGERPIVGEILRETERNALAMDMVNNNYVYSRGTSKETLCNKEMDTSEDTDVRNSRTRNDKDATDNEDDDDDCLSLFAKESFDESVRDNAFSDEKDESGNFVESDARYEMSATMFNRYMKQTANEFDEEFAECAKNNAMNGGKGVFDERASRASCAVTKVHDTATTQSGTVRSVGDASLNNETNLMNFVKGYCFATLRNSACPNPSQCKYEHDLQRLVRTISSHGPDVISRVIRDAHIWSFSIFWRFFCEKIYVASLSKLSVEQILTIYKLAHNSKGRVKRDDYARISIARNIVKELLKRRIPLKDIVDRLVACIVPNRNITEFENILTCAEVYVKNGEYWNTMRSSILQFQPNINILRVIQKILCECIEIKNFVNIRDVNSNLMSKLDPALRSMLNRQSVEDFNGLIAETTVTDSNSVTTNRKDLEECSRVETIVSPDSKPNASSSRMRLSEERDVVSIDEIDTNGNEREATLEENSVNNVSYRVQPIDDLPDAGSIYREHANLWKFYVDLDRFKKGLVHKDYDYVIDILKNYTEKPDENSLFVRSCCSMLRTEVKRSEYHLEQILQRTDKNITCTSRLKWHVESTVNDEHMRNKIVCILLDLLCIEFIQRAFLLFQFLLKDQCGRYHPIGKCDALSCIDVDVNSYGPSLGETESLN